jgi:hypothetical protein
VVARLAAALDGLDEDARPGAQALLESLVKVLRSR